jgi:BlaI family transcriptional regulator, penicillinase repressor
MNSKSSLDERELEILQALWAHGPQKPSDLQPRLSIRMKNGALRWLLNDLVARGLLKRQKEGKAFFYTAEIERRSLLESLGERLRDILFGGSAVAMIGELAESQKISAKDLAYLHKVAVKPRPTGKRKS